jgi:hypothetical protein
LLPAAEVTWRECDPVARGLTVGGAVYTRPMQAWQVPAIFSPILIELVIVALKALSRRLCVLAEYVVESLPAGFSFWVERERKLHLGDFSLREDRPVC